MPSRQIKSFLRARIAQFNTDFQDSVKSQLEVPAKKLTRKHRMVVGSWNNKPVFAYRITVNGQEVRLTVYPRGDARQRYLWIDRGTKPYTIRPKNGAYMRFQTGYSPRTGTGGKYNVGTGGRFGGWVSAKQINHPGIAARQFSEKFAKDILPDMRQTIEQAFKLAVKGQS